ncbi:mitochondrial 37S ribosomal protein bS18m Ecym_4379 [Eremothecium cymbalariae DBVPG|uniref:Small ribosomal subunit protein bS18m n=1 Tax=Eremothecium cymbalariae (strain CBS 270.75 / DBVPG 7215 / KCTC 17166 / NRRL Y-17582) TaxID=931890 RepID=G8JTT1_ERECY|nr:hypothetical protein Ecym_4379 [Eremothecium cymbalariae DBVPG\
MTMVFKCALQLPSRRLFSRTNSCLNGSNIDFSIFEEPKKVNDATDIEVKKLDSSLLKKFPLGNVYNPFDFSMERLHLDKKFAKNGRWNSDIFDHMKANPLDFYTNPEFLSRFLTSTGRIQHRDVTGLSVKNQRRLAKAIKRCQAIGLMSKTHKDVSFLPTRMISNK